MAWGDNGITIARELLDQQAVSTGWTTSQVRVNFKAFRTAGYMRKFRLFTPQVTVAITHGLGTSALQANGQLTPARAFNRIQTVMQGIAFLYDIEGLSVPYLRQANSGHYATDNLSYGYDMRNGSINPNSASGVATSAQYGMFNGTLVANTSFVFCYLAELPLSELIIFRDSVVAQKQGSVVIADKPLEIGIITLQNTQSNVMPICQLNPLTTLTATNPDAQLQVTSNDTATASPTWNITSDLFDVPDVATQRPLPWQQAFVITRQDFDTPMSGGAATINWKPAGFLMRFHARFMDANNNLVDIGAVPAATIDTKWGATVSKFTTSVQENLARIIDVRSNSFPLPGAIDQNFLDYDGTATDFVNTAILPNVRTELKGFSTGTAIATVRACETRMIPVKVG